MARVSTYLNFMGTTEEAFSHYAKVFETEAKMLHRFSVVGNNTTISLEFDSVDEAHQINEGLAEGSTDCVPIQEIPWRAYWGVALDRFGIRWMFNAPITATAQ